VEFHCRYTAVATKLAEAQTLSITSVLNGSVYHLNDDRQPQHLHFRQNNAGLNYEVNRVKDRN